MAQPLGSINLLLVACAATPNAQAVRAAVTRLFADGWNRGNVAAFDHTIAETVVFHYAGTRRQLSREDMSDIVRRWRDRFPTCA